jgi:aerobic-type carbon monoxide dehydrogenase small subunit (CoxS/CutS family)
MVCALPGAIPVGRREPFVPRYSIVVNETRRDVDATPDMPLLWVLRDLLGLTGTKYGCGVGVCGACTVREGATTQRSCQLTIADASGRSFTTIEGLAAAGGGPLQQAWLEADVAHCGYCQPGMLLAASALLESRTPVDDAAIEQALDSHLCRCGSYPRIRLAMKQAVEQLQNVSPEKGRRPGAKPGTSGS